MKVFLNEIFGLSLSALTVWGFLMALLINTLMHMLTNNNYLPSIVCSAIVFSAYFTADDLFFYTKDASLYLNWFVLDLVTIFLLYLFIRLLKLGMTVACKYVFASLGVSSLLLLSMYADLVILSNNEPWFLWDLYVYGGTIIDFTMISVLIVNKDVLQLNRLFQFLTRKKVENPPAC